THEELLLLIGAELVCRRVEDGERQDVGLIEWRRARQAQLGLAERTEYADAHLDALNYARHGHVDLRRQTAFEIDRARRDDVEPGALEDVRAGNRVERSGDEHLRAGILVEIEIAGGAQVDVAQTDRRAGRHLHVVALEAQRAGDVQREVQAQPIPRI